MSHPILRPNARTTIRATFQPTPGNPEAREASLPAGTHVYAQRTAEGWDLLAWVDAPATGAPDYVRGHAHRFEWLFGTEAVATDA